MTKQSFRLMFFLLIFLSIPLTSTAQIVDIPDPNLRVAIEKHLGIAPGAIITVADMATLTELNASNTDISDVTGLEAATNLKTLDLGGEIIANSFINSNSISDISPIAALINLTKLRLADNSISDISAIEELTNLAYLDLSNNSISDISAIEGVNYLSGLELYDNSISDLSSLVANTKLAGGTRVDVRGNPLNAESINTHIPTLQSRGITVKFDDIVAQPADVNGDGVVNIFDLVLVGAQFGKRGENLATDVNRDGIVDVRDLVLVAARFGEEAAAPSAHPQASEILTVAAVRGWLTDTKALEIEDPIMERGIMVLEQLLASLTPTETELLPNYPNPFNPETWIPYRLAKDTFVTLTIYDGAGHVVRTIDVGLQITSAYESQSQAIYWDGRNEIGEQVASGVYFYHLSAGDYSATRKMLILK